MTTATPNRRLTEDLRADALVALVVIAALTTGWVYKNSLLSRTTLAVDPASQFALRLPSHWSTTESDSADTFLTAENPRAGSIYKTAIVGKTFLLDETDPASLDTLVDQLIKQHGDELLGYHLLDAYPKTIAGAEGRVIEYAYVVQPIDQPFRAAVPVVVHAYDYVIYTPKEYWVVTLTSDEQLAEKERPTYEQIVASMKLP
jgi:hypothetical protein